MFKREMRRILRHFLGDKKTQIHMSPQEVETLKRESAESQSNALPSTTSSMHPGRFNLVSAQSQPGSRLGMEAFIIEENGAMSISEREDALRNEIVENEQRNSRNGGE